MMRHKHWWAEVEITPQFYDIDSMDVVWHGHYVKYLERARCALLDQLGYNYEDMRQSGYAWPVVDLRMKYIRPARFKQPLLIRADLEEWENRLKINYIITDKATREKIHQAMSIQVAVDMQTGEMCYVSPPALVEKVLGKVAP